MTMAIYCYKFYFDFGKSDFGERNIILCSYQPNFNQIQSTKLNVEVENSARKHSVRKNTKMH